MISVHWNCLKYSKGLANRIKEFAISRKVGWECIQCKRCGTCQQKITERPNVEVQNNEETVSVFKQNGFLFLYQIICIMFFYFVQEKASSCSLQIVLCETCDGGFHATCTKESFEKKETESSWTCSRCREDKKEISPTGSSTFAAAKRK